MQRFNTNYNKHTYGGTSSDFLITIAYENRAKDVINYLYSQLIDITSK